MTMGKVGIFPLRIKEGITCAPRKPLPLSDIGLNKLSLTLALSGVQGSAVMRLFVATEKGLSMTDLFTAFFRFLGVLIPAVVWILAISGAWAWLDWLLASRIQGRWLAWPLRVGLAFALLFIFFAVTWSALDFLSPYRSC